MKSRISYCLIVAFALFFSACDRDFNDPVEDDESGSLILIKDVESDSSEENDATDLIEEDEPVIDVEILPTGCEYTVFSDGLSVIIIDGRQEYVTRFKLIDDFGNTEFAYCANMEAPCYEGARYKCASADDYFKNGEDIKIMAALTYIINNYGWMEASNPHGYRQMTQAIIWMIIHGYEVTYVNNPYGEIIKEVVNHIYDNIEDITDSYNVGVTMQGDNTATADGLFVNYGPYTVSDNALLNDVDFELTVYPNDKSVKFVNASGIEITQVKPEVPFYVRVPENIFGDFKFTATATTSRELWYVVDFRFFVDKRDGDYQQLFQPVVSSQTLVQNYSCEGNITIPEEDCVCLILK